MMQRIQDLDLKCPHCAKKWANEVTRPWDFTCRGCKKTFMAIDKAGETAIIEVK